MKHTTLFFAITLFLILFISYSVSASSNRITSKLQQYHIKYSQPQADDPNPPASPIRLIFIHHSTGGYWLSDTYGGLGIALRDNNYFVSDTNYGWGPDSIGDYTDIGHWWVWFRGDNSPTNLDAMYHESGQTDQFGAYSRLPVNPDPDGENQIILFKSCFPNSGLQGSQSDPIPPIGNNPLRGQPADSQYHTFANAKGIYIDLLNYFITRPDKLFVVITAPPLTDGTYADNARAFNNWLVNNWLAGYPLNNVAVFDYYNVLTTNNGNPSQNDFGLETGNHHRWWNGAVQHKTDGDDDNNPNILEYPTEDDHPSQAGDQKATGEFVTMLNIFYNRWMSNNGTPTPTLTTTVTPTGPTTTITPKPTKTTTSKPTKTATPAHYEYIINLPLVTH